LLHGLSIPSGRGWAQARNGREKLKTEKLKAKRRCALRDQGQRVASV
jgi:hypothetical protein